MSLLGIKARSELVDGRARSGSRAGTVGGKVIGSDLAVAHDNLSVGIGGNGGFMSDDDDCGAVGAGGVQEEFHDFFGVQTVQGAGGLIGKQDLRLNGEGAGDSDALDLAAGKFSGKLVALSVDPHAVQPMFGLVIGDGARMAAQ